MRRAGALPRFLEMFIAPPTLLFCRLLPRVFMAEHTPFRTRRTRRADGLSGAPAHVQRASSRMTKIIAIAIGDHADCARPLRFRQRRLLARNAADPSDARRRGPSAFATKGSVKPLVVVGRDRGDLRRPVAQLTDAGMRIAVLEGRPRRRAARRRHAGNCQEIRCRWRVGRRGVRRRRGRRTLRRRIPRSRRRDRRQRGRCAAATRTLC